MSVEKGCCSKPDWAIGLEPRGLYYEGYTDTLQELLNKHSSDTVTTYGIRKSHSCNKQSTKALVEDKENIQVPALFT